MSFSNPSCASTKNILVCRSLPLVLAAALGALVACATLPPVVPIRGLQSIEGSWKGYGGTEQRGLGPLQMTIRRDGSLELCLPGKGTRRRGQARVADGRVLFETAEATGTMTLREGAGRRVLLGVTKGKSFPDDGS